jgi:hypothetical protein
MACYQFHNYYNPTTITINH